MQVSEKLFRIQKRILPHWKALLFSYLELQVKGAQPPNTASTHNPMKLDHFLQLVATIQSVIF